MGNEFLIEPLKYLGLVLLILLVYLSAKTASRAFALPTLVAAVVWAYLDVAEANQPSQLWTRYAISFVVGCSQFGAFAFSINWLLRYKERRARSANE